MKIGKIPENVLKRSVLKQIKPNTNRIEKGASVGSDCAFLHTKDSVIAVATGYVAIPDKNIMSHAILQACNNIAAGGATPLSIELHISLPETYLEIDLKMMMAKASHVAKALNLDITGGHTETVKGLDSPIVAVTAIGLLDNEKNKMCPVHDGQEIVMTKWLGLSGTSYIAIEKEDELLTKYPFFFIKDAQAFEKYYSILPEAVIATRANVSAMHDISGGGVFGALWDLAENAGVGLSVSLKKIPVKQETIEICEFFDLNPYELRADGSLLIITDNGDDLIRKLKQEGISANVIGKVTSGNDRIVINEDEIRYLEPPRTDELLKVL